jgi:hypothetical protein
MPIGNFIGKMIGSGVIEGAKGIAGIVDQFMETPDEKRAAEIVNRKLQQRPDELQIEINKAEAGHRSLFVAGWRPAVGWSCVFALVYGWIAQPIAEFIIVIAGVKLATELPAISVGEAISLLMALLGMGALRTYEKQSRITK